MTENENSPIRSVDRALAIIETLTKHSTGLGLIELSREVGLNKSTTYRMLCAIMSRGWVIKDPKTNNYKLTLKLFELGSRVVSDTNVLTVARPLLEELSSQLGETMHLVVRDGTDVVYICKEASEQTIKMGSQIGKRNPLFVTGVGKAILSFLSEEEVEHLWNISDIRPRTVNTRTDFGKIREELKLSAQRGWALDDEENEVGVRCVAVPVLNSERCPVAAISASGSVFRITPDKFEYYAGLLKKTAAEVSRQLGI